jgi:hypothetical protein
MEGLLSWNPDALPASRNAQPLHYARWLTPTALRGTLPRSGFVPLTKAAHSGDRSIGATRQIACSERRQFAYMFTAAAVRYCYIRRFAIAG